MEENLLTIKEAAAKYRVSEEAIRRWIRGGYIPYIMVGPFKIRRIREEDILTKKVNDVKRG